MSVAKTAQTRRERRLAERAARRGERRRSPAAGRRLGIGTLSLFGLLGGVAVVVLAVVFGAGPASAPTGTADVTIARVPAGLASDGFVLGRADAPVTIDLYEDFQCPACQAWGESVFPSLASNELQGGRVRIVFHDMAFLGPESSDAGRAAYAAAQQDRFWDMWATIYANQGRENSGAFGRERLVAMAERLGLDGARFEADMDSAAAQATLDRSRADAARSGVTSTPTLIIEGRAFVGVQPYADIAAAIAAAAP
jgi:protein-disulfide isomerase